MLDTAIPEATQKLEIVPRRIEVAFGEGDGSLVRLSLPPVEELLAIRALPAQQISLNQVADSAEEFFQAIFANEAARMEQKSERYGNSATFLCRLASLKELAGDLVGAQAQLERAVQVNVDDVAYLKLGTNLFRQKRFGEAKKIYSAACLSKSVDASLRLALLSIVEGDLKRAREYADDALRNDSLDYRARLISGAIYLANADYEMAIRQFRTAAEENPTSALVLVNLAVAQLCTGHPSKAIRALKTAVRLNPINTNAIALLADLSFAQNVGEQAIGPLEILLGYEQKMPSMWARLARAYFSTKEHDKALRALRHEASLRASASVWNNIGVCIWEKGDLGKAIQTFKYALTRTDEKGEAGRDSALLNVLGALAQDGKSEEVFRLSEEAINKEGVKRFAASERLYPVCVHNLTSLARRGRFEEFERRIEYLLGQTFIAPRLREGLLANVLHHFTIERPDPERAVMHAKSVADMAARDKISSDRPGQMALNNAAFALIHVGELEKAEQLLQKLSKYIHVSPYPTATLGLLHFARGHVDRGTKLYEEAIALLNDGRLRRLFGQKLNLERARYFYQSGDLQTARKYVQLVLQVKDGIPKFISDAEFLLGRLER
jgi:tetratricopeptide (TPR) repeat protein